VRLGPGTPGDYVRARVLVSLKPGCDNLGSTVEIRPTSERADAGERERLTSGPGAGSGLGPAGLTGRAQW
jgi:hypothetical protein